VALLAHPLARVLLLDVVAVELHGDDAPAKRRHRSALMPPYSNVPDVSSTTSVRLPGS
jgi:hypothetical protein